MTSHKKNVRSCDRSRIIRFSELHGGYMVSVEVSELKVLVLALGIQVSYMRNALENYDPVEVGMSRDEAESILVSSESALLKFGSALYG